ncbi:hypothetical protein [Streptomyces sp900116325]|uniref:Uncharacterized protein n=1 Tax=Streptomyces sp. 900116325 TaxID=3154295 RepID=A0ABV2UG10_9ACTN
MRGDGGGHGQALVGVGDDPHGLRAEAAAVRGGQAGGACGETFVGQDGGRGHDNPLRRVREISTDWYQCRVM